MISPLLKWAGGKRWLIGTISKIWQIAGRPRLVEPFCGGLSISLGLLPEYAILNDINPHLINFYQWIQRGFSFDFPEDNTSTYYYAQRQRFNGLIKNGDFSTIESARLFYYLNRTCFNGLCRFNHDGLFNVPVGSLTNTKYISDFSAYKGIFQRWIFTSGSFLDLNLNPDDLIFADPPYDVDFRNYSKDGFTWSDQILLVKWLNKHPGPIILCNQATERVIDLYRDNDFELHFLQEKINISANGERRLANVVLAIKNLPSMYLINSELSQPMIFILNNQYHQIS